MDSILKHRTIRLLLATLCLLPLAAASEDTLAGELTAALHRDKQNLRLEVSVPSPPPSSIIAGITLPNNTKIVETSPASAKIDARGASVKWLVKTPRPGTLRFTASTSPPADVAGVSAEVLYRAPGGGKLIKVNATKR